MKLKKIASLALAGIMAVSMLAGCNGSSNNGTNPPASSSEPTTTGIVSAVKDAIKITNSDLTVDVKESAFLNDQLSKMIDEHTLEDIKANNLVTDGIKAAFGLNVGTTVNDYNTISANTLQAFTDRFEDNDIDEFWYYGIIENGTVNAGTAETLAARAIAEQMSYLEDEFADDTDPTNVKLLSYTMYVSQMNATKVGDSSVPTVFMVLKVNVSQKTI